MFELGQIVITTNAQGELKQDDVMKGLGRHANNDWGDIDDEDRAANDAAVEEGTRISSAYRSGDTKFWIITEADRSATTILLPEDY